MTAEFLAATVPAAFLAGSAAQCGVGEEPTLTVAIPAALVAGSASQDGAGKRAPGDAILGAGSAAQGGAVEQALLKSPPEEIIPALSAKKLCTKWGKGEARDKISRAVEDWFGEKGLQFDENGELIMNRTL